jgi:hypothetical protein
MSVVRIIGKVMLSLFQKRNICRPRRKRLLLKVTIAESDISWQDLEEEQSVIQKENT